MTELKDEKAISLDKQAYKLYLRESWLKIDGAHINLIPKNQFIAELWKQKAPKKLLLNETNINKLVALAKTKKFEFQNPMFANGKHGRSIADGLKLENLESFIDESHLRELARLLGLNEFKDFEKDSLLSRKFRAKLNALKEKALLCFILYYWYPNAIGKAIVRFELPKDSEKLNPEDCTITYYNTTGKVGGQFQPFQGDGILGIGRTEVSVSYWSESNIYVFATKTCPTFLTIHLPIQKLRDARYAYCTYSTSSPNERVPVSGVGILRKISPGKEDAEINREVKPGFYQNLFQRRAALKKNELISSSKDPLFNFEETPLETLEISGLYLGYYLDKHYDGNNDNDGALRSLLLDIHESGQVMVYDGEKGHGKHKGFCFLASNKKILFIHGDYDTGGTPRYQLVINLPKDGHETNLEGIAAGYSKENLPFTTMIRLNKLKEFASQQDIEEALERICNYNMKKQEEPDFEKNHEEIIRFFFGNKFSSPPENCLRPASTEISTLSGIYQLYSFSARYSGIIQYPVLIHNNGKVVIRTEEKELTTGMATKQKDEFICLDFFNYYKGGAFMGAFLFKTKNFTGAFSTGVSMRINSNSFPQAKREYIIPHMKKELVNTDISLLEAEFANLKFQLYYPEDAEYKKLEEEYPDIATLWGREFNLIIEKTDPLDALQKPEREEYKRIYFNEAMLAYMKSRSDTLKYSHHFERAVEHGLFNEEEYKRLRDEFYSFVNLPVPKEEIDKIFLPLLNTYRIKFVLSRRK